MAVEQHHLVLEQFCKVPHIDFGSVQPGASATASLTLHNPTGQVQHVFIDPVNEPTLTLCPMELELAPESKQDVCLTWTPTEGSTIGKNYRVAISIRMEGRKRFKAIATGTSLMKSGRRKKNQRRDSTFEFTEIDENIIRNGPTSIAWKAEFRKVSSAPKAPAEALGAKRPVPFISPSKIVRYFSQEKQESDNLIEIDVEGELREEKVDVVIEGRKHRRGGVAFDADFTIKLPKAQPMKSKLLQTEGSSKRVDIKPVLRKSCASEHAEKRKALIEISRSVLTPAKKKVKASASSYRDGQFFDEDWARKQENAFKTWLNFVFKERETPHAFMIDRDLSSYQSITEFRAHGQVLQKAFSCYHSKPVQNIIYAIEQAVSSGQMRIRNDICMLNDVGLRDRFVDLLHSYNSAWLKLGLETVYGEMLPVSACLRSFIQTRLLSNSEIDSEHTYLKTSQGQPFFDEKHKTAMQSFVLKKVMQIAIFLDIAKSQNVFHASPRLFVTGGSIKSTRSFLIEFASIFMAAQGDIVKFISQLSQYECAAVQTPLDEFDYQLSDLTGDLKDGVRLCALSEEPGIERQILLPAINKSRKKHNVSLALQSFARSGVSMVQCTADDVVDGNRQRVLILLWNIISHLTIPSLIDIPTLFNEVRLIRRQSKCSQTCKLYADNDRYQLLLQWCEQICLHFDIPIRNFTSSFSDGRGFAAIISYYCPMLIKESDIKMTTRSLQDRLQKKKSCAFSAPSDDMMSGTTWIQFLHLQASSDEVNEALEGERHNWRVLANAVRRLGAVPFVFADPGRNMKQSMVLEEKTVLLFLSYLCSRLLTLSKESHAARAVQRRWREIQWRKRVLLVPQASDILSDVISSYYQHHLLRKHLSQLQTVQIVICTFLTQKQIRTKWDAVCIIQERWRAHTKRKRLMVVRAAIGIIHGPILSCYYNREALQCFSHVRVLQGSLRTVATVHLNQTIKASTALISAQLLRYRQWSASRKLQSMLLMYEQRKRYNFNQNQMKTAVTFLECRLHCYHRFRAIKVVQTELHCLAVHKRYVFVRASAITISIALQTLLSVHQFRSFKDHLLKTIAIQSALKTARSQQNVQGLREARRLDAIVAVQSAFCSVLFSKLSRNLLQNRYRHSRVKIQRSVRRFIQFRRLSREQLKFQSLQTMAAVLHCVTAVRCAQRIRCMVLRIQSLWRGRKQRLRASKKVRQARERIFEASSRWALELTIGYRLKQALDVLLSGCKLSELTQACRMLDHVTRTLPRCCIDAVDHNAVPVLYALMRGLNRSKPHIELLGYAVSILATLSQHPSVSSHIFNDESCLDVMLELLQTQRENPDLFIKIARLLQTGCSHDSFTYELRKSAKRLSSIHALLFRKLEMNIRYQQPGSAIHSKQLTLLDRSVKAVESLQQRIR